MGRHTVSGDDRPTRVGCGRFRIFAAELLAPEPGQHAKGKEGIHARRAVEEQGLWIRAHL